MRYVLLEVQVEFEESFGIVELARIRFALVTMIFLLEIREGT